LAVGSFAQEVVLIEGQWPNADAKLSLIKFPSMQHLKDYLNSEAYMAIKHLRTDIIASNFSVALG